MIDNIYVNLMWPWHQKKSSGVSTSAPSPCYNNLCVSIVHSHGGTNRVDTDFNLVDYLWIFPRCRSHQFCYLHFGIFVSWKITCGLWAAHGWQRIVRSLLWAHIRYNKRHYQELPDMPTLSNLPNICMRCRVVNRIFYWMA